jgi:hypothetical protein
MKKIQKLALLNMLVKLSRYPEVKFCASFVLVRRDMEKEAGAMNLLILTLCINIWCD